MSYQDEQDIELLKSKEYLFWRGVTPVPESPEECWSWYTGKDSNGYGAINLGNDANGRRMMIRAHRFSYILLIASIPEDMYCLHTCDNPECCNPAHLFLGTQKDNVQDMDRKGRRVTTEGYTHTEETRKKISEGTKNPSTEIREKMSRSHMGKTPSPETRKKLSESIRKSWIQRRESTLK